jgi:hypothetical protein
MANIRYVNRIISLCFVASLVASCGSKSKQSANNQSIQTAQKPSFSLAPGEYLENQRLELKSNLPAAQIFFTTDGSEPSAQSNVYSEPLELSGGTTVKMFARAQGLNDSEVVTGTFNVRSMLKNMRLFLPTHYNHSVAQASDGTVYFPEYGKKRLMRQSPSGVLEAIYTEQGGMLTVFVDPQDRLYVSLDMGDTKDANGRFIGSVVRVDNGANGTKVLTPVIKFVRRPRQMAWDGVKLYVQLEAERMIISCDVDQGACEYPDTVATQTNAKKAIIEVDNRSVVPPPNGMTFRNGTFYWAEYGIFQQRADGSKWVEMGRIRSKSPGQPAVTLKDGLGRTRGVGFDTAGNLYFTTEANEKDQGNTGTLARLLPDSTGKISANSKYELLLDKVDYPQFIKVLHNGEVLVPLARENWMGLYDPKLKMEKQAVSESFIEMYAQNLTVTSGDSAAKLLSFNFPEFGKKFDYLINTQDPGLKTGWLKINIKGLNLPEDLFKKYVNYPPFPSPLIPGPGFYRIPSATCEFDAKPCSMRGIVYRTQVLWRWPMFYPNGVETPADGFSEDPDHFLFNFNL